MRKKAVEKTGELIDAATPDAEVTTPKRTLRGIRLGKNLDFTAVAPQIISTPVARAAAVPSHAPARNCLDAIRACLGSPPRLGLATYLALLMVVGGLVSIQYGGPESASRAPLAMSARAPAGSNSYGLGGYHSAAYQSYPGPNYYRGGYYTYRAGPPAGNYGYAPGY